MIRRGVRVAQSHTEPKARRLERAFRSGIRKEVENVMDRLDSFVDIVSGLEPRDILGALMVGFVVSLCSAAVYMVYRRKVTDALSLLVGLMFVVSAASMVLAVGLLRASTEARQMQDGPFNGMSFDGQPPVGPMFGAHAAWGTNWPREPHSIAQRRIQGE